MKMICGLLAACVIAAAVAGPASGAGKSDARAWHKLKGQIVSSVVWSPDGRSIAFVVTPKDPLGFDEIFYVTRASIWLAPVGDRLGAPKLVHTARVGRLGYYGVPLGLFWLSDKRLGWAASNCEFHSLDLRNGKSRELTSLSANISLNQSRAYEDCSGLDDVYHDPRSHQLIVTGWVPRLPYSVAYMYDTRTGKLRRVPFPKINALLTMSSWTSSFKTHDGYRHDYYIAGELFRFGGIVLWHASGDPDNEVEQLAKGDNDRPIFFPRPSPDGRRLLWMTSPSDARHPHQDRWDVVLLDSRAKTRRVIAHIPNAAYWKDIMPALGCPFSWSPKGDRVAYAYGDRIRVVRVR